MAKHVYVDPSKFRAPLNYPNLTLTGLGEDLRSKWPAGRSYVDVSRFQAPYLDYYFQNNQLFGLGANAVGIPAKIPPDFDTYLKTGAPMSTVRRDLGSALAQVPRIAWGLLALGAGYMTYKAHKLYKSELPKKRSGTGE